MFDRIYSNRVTEKDIRSWMSSNGFKGASALFDEIELHAVRRPGWIQLFRFASTVKNSDGESMKLFGCVLDDERNSLDVWAFENINLQRAKLTELSEGMIVQRNRRSNGQASAKGDSLGKVAGLGQILFFLFAVILLAFGAAMLGAFLGA